MPYVISGVIEAPRSLIIRTPEDFAKQGIQVLTRHRVVTIDAAKQQLTVKNLQDNTDAIVSYDRLIRGDIANLQGKVAGENAAGGHAYFPGVLGTAIFKTFNLTVASTGLSEKAALEAGFNPVSVQITANDCAGYYPGKQTLTLTLTANRNDGRLLGCQSVGFGKVDKMIDIAATALLGQLTCSELAYADFAYAPPFSPALSPIIVAASLLSDKLNT